MSDEWISCDLPVSERKSCEYPCKIIVKKGHVLKFNPGNRYNKQNDVYICKFFHSDMQAEDSDKSFPWNLKQSTKRNKRVAILNRIHYITYDAKRRKLIHGKPDLYIKTRWGKKLPERKGIAKND